MAKKEYKTLAKIKKNLSGTYDLFLSKRQNIIDTVVELMKVENQEEIHIQIIFKPVGQKKSNKKLGYFYAEVLPKITYGLIDLGNWEVTEETAYLYLCKRFLGGKSIVVNGETLDEIKTLSDIDDDEMRIFLDKCIKFGNIDLKINIQSPDDYHCEQNNFS